MPTIDRNPRSATTRSTSERKKPWRPSSSLEAPKPKDGYKHRWIRTEVRGYEDKTNVLIKSIILIFNPQESFLTP